MGKIVGTVVGTAVALGVVAGLGLWRADEGGGAENAVGVADECPAEIGQGNHGPCVVEIQRQLNELGAQPPLNVDGIAGPKTKRALVEFQRKHGLAADGVAGPKTRRAISDALAAGVPPPTPTSTPPSPAPVPAAPALEWRLERGTYTFNRTFTRQIADHAARYKLEKRTTEMFECNIAGSLVTKGLVIGRVPGVGAYIAKGKSSMCKRMTKRAANDLVATAKEAAAANACLVNETGDYAGFFQGGETFRVERGTKCWN